MSDLRCLHQGEPEDLVAVRVPSADGSGLALELSYKELSGAVGLLSDGFSRIIGFGTGSESSSVALILPNCAELVAAFFSLVNLGFPVAPLNPQSSKEEFITNLVDLNAVALVVPSSGDLRATVGSSLQDGIAAATHLGLSVVEVGQKEKIFNLNVLLNKSCRSTTVTAVAPKASDVALLLQTSGTTSKPKVVPLSHANILASATNIVRTYALNSSDRTLIVMPLFHVHGLIGGLFATLLSRGSAVIPPKFSASQFLPTLLSHNCTWFTAVPTIHKILLARPEHLDLTRLSVTKFGRLRFVRSCSSALAPITFAQLESVFGVPVLQAYAMTEAAHQMTSNPLPPLDRKSDSVGIAQGVDIGIFDGHCAPQPVNITGEVCVCGPNVTAGYVGNAAANSTNFFRHNEHLWFRTGDQGYLDTDGYLFLTGRLKELINRGGEKISPLEIDAVLLTHPQVAEAVAFGLPHPIYGEEVYAGVVLKSPATAEDLKRFCSEHLAAFKCPKQIFIATQLPQTATGKVQRRHVADHFSKQLVSKL